MIIGGDFNAVISQKDRSSQFQGCPALSQLVQGLQLKDTWDLQQSGGAGYTYYYQAGASQLDRIYVTKNLQYCVRNADICPVEFSNHCAYMCKIRQPALGAIRGRGTWKLNQGILENEDLKERFHEEWKLWKKQIPRYMDTLEWWMRYAKTACNTVHKVQNVADNSTIQRNFIIIA